MINLLSQSGAFDSVLETLSKPLVIVGIVLATLGLALTFVAKRLTSAIKKVDGIKTNDGLYITFRVISIAMIVIALVLVVI